MRRILIVEDDVLLSGTLAYNLRAEGYEVAQAFSCAEARQAVQADVVLLDVNLPDGDGRALEGVDFSVEEGEFVAVVGTSGSGKSTLLHMLGGLDTPTAGSVMVRGKELAQMDDDQLTIFRRRNIGFVFQNYNLVPILNVQENIVLPVELDGNRVDPALMEEVVGMLGLREKLESLPNTLSGGQQQRVAIARALVAGPAIVLADEPTGNLDSHTSADVMGLLRRMSTAFHQTLVMITHNSEIAQLADRIVRIEDGRIVERG